MAGTSRELTMRPYDSSDEESVLRLLRETLGESPATLRTPEFWRWKHFQNPFGPSFARVACNSTGEVVSLRAFMQWQFQIDGRRVRAVQAVDTATHTAYRRRGIFSALTRQLLEEVRGAGIQLIFNTPNVYSRPGYSKLGWLDVGTVTPLFRILRPSRSLVRFLGASLGRRSRPRLRHPQGSFPEAGELLDHPHAVEKLVERHDILDAGTGTITTSRSPEYLQWRYTRHPNLTYSAVTIRKRGQLHAGCIFRANSRFGLSEMILSELFLVERSHKLCHELLNRVKSAFSADYLVAYSRRDSFVRAALQQYGFRVPPDSVLNLLFENRFLRLPERQKPRRLMVNVLSSDLAVNPFELENWALSAGDLEVF